MQVLSIFQRTVEQAFDHLSKMNNNLGLNIVRDKNIFSPGWSTAIVSDIGRGDF